LLCLATGADAFPRFTFLAQTAASGFHLELVKIGLRVVWAVTAKVPKVVTFLGSIRCHKKPPRISSCLSLSWESSLKHETWIARLKAEGRTNDLYASQSQIWHLVCPLPTEIAQTEV
jgi:hypothetical protein